MSFNFKVGGAWETLASGWVKVGGTWQQVQSAWVKVAGTWQQVYASWSLAFTGTTAPVTATNSGANATAELKFDTDGYVYYRQNLTGGYTQIGQWISDVTEAATSGAEVFWSSLTGDAFDFATAGDSVPHDITASAFIVYITDTSPLVTDGPSNSFDMYIRDAGDVVQDVQTYSLSAEREDF